MSPSKLCLQLKQKLVLAVVREVKFVQLFGDFGPNLWSRTHRRKRNIFQRGQSNFSEFFSDMKCLVDLQQISVVLKSEKQKTKQNQTKGQIHGYIFGYLIQLISFLLHNACISRTSFVTIGSPFPSLLYRVENKNISCNFIF